MREVTKEHLLKRCLPPLLIIVAGLLVYWNSFDGVFIYDDIGAIQDNSHIRRLWPVSDAMSLPLWGTGATVDGRPLLSLSFALNHALFGPEPWGYHLVNLLIHIAAGLLLFGVVRCTLDLPKLRSVRRASGAMQGTGGEVWIALATALIWLVHPLQTESVTYIVQRAESLMGMLFLLTLYCAIRGLAEHGAWSREQGGSVQCSVSSDQKGEFTGRTERNEKGRGWHVAAVIACAIGMGVKQTMFSAPLLVLLYDWVFVSGGFRASIRRRKWFYGALCATWLIVFGIIGATWKESTIDFVNISPIRYLMTQPLVILYYLRLAVWPSPLVLDYGWMLEDQWPRIVFPGLAIMGMLAVMFRGLWHRKWYGFVVAWFFLILAPTSSIAPTKQAIFEHRMYLSLATVVLLVTIAFAQMLRKLLADSKQRASAGLCLAVAAVVLLGYRTHDRNRDYHSSLELWRENVLHRPGSFDAHVGLGDALKSEGKLPEAIEHYRAAVQLRPESPVALNNLGNALLESGYPQEAVTYYREALRLKPDHAEAHSNWGKALEVMGQRDEAIPHYQRAVQMNPQMAGAHVNLGNVMQASGRTREALGHYRQALQADPDYADAHNNVANALLLLGKAHEAIPHYREALRVEPGFAEAHYGWGVALAAIGKIPEAIEHFEQALRLKPDHAGARESLRNARGTVAGDQ